MSNYVCNGAMCVCSCGTCPANLIVTPENQATHDNQPAANIMDNKPMANIPSFGMCTVTGIPKPCTPAVSSPWAPGNPKCLIGGQPALANESNCVCSNGGMINIVYPGQVDVQGQ